MIFYPNECLCLKKLRVQNFKHGSVCCQAVLLQKLIQEEVSGIRPLCGERSIELRERRIVGSVPFFVLRMVNIRVVVASSVGTRVVTNTDQPVGNQCISFSLDLELRLEIQWIPKLLMNVPPVDTNQQQSRS